MNRFTNKKKENFQPREEGKKDKRISGKLCFISHLQETLLMTIVRSFVDYSVGHENHFVKHEKSVL